MGASQGGPFCCSAGGQSVTSCCARDAGSKGLDIIRARPMSYPEVGEKVHVDGHKEEPAPEAPDRAHAQEEPQQPTAVVAANQAPAGASQSHDPDGGVEGEETYEDGSSYVGQIADGRRHGRGVWTSPLETYTGQWKCDQRDGHGRQTWQDGRVYEGQFKEGKFHGHGRMEWHMPNGVMVYEGQYVDDLKHGTGRYVWPDNRVYDGEWKRGQRCGKATYINSLGQKRIGLWKDDKVERWLDDPAAAPSGAGSEARTGGGHM